ncbi:MAG: hypothetical protein Q8906_09685 [Bacillota bacterium]|nr:hypothetical protein [Bacillota bacterium]MDP4170866.1 hypothetical protein [Bacillota bacterium]
MNDFLKKGFMLGLGAAISSKEKFEEAITNLVQKGMMSRSEADSLFDEFMKKGEAKTESWNQEFQSSIKKQFKEMGFVTQEDVDILKAQLVFLQEEINVLRNEKLDSN